jgi:hypothetical protein
VTRAVSGTQLAFGCGVTFLVSHNNNNNSNKKLVESLLIFTAPPTPVASSADGIINMIPAAAVNHAAGLDAGGRVSLLSTFMKERRESHQRKSKARDLLLSKKLAVHKKAQKEIDNDTNLQIQLIKDTEEDALKVLKATKEEALKVVEATEDKAVKVAKEGQNMKQQQNSEALRLISEMELELNQEKEEEDEELYRLLEFNCINFNMTDEEREAMLETFDPIRARRRSVLPRRVTFP